MINIKRLNNLVENNIKIKKFFSIYLYIYFIYYY